MGIAILGTFVLREVWMEGFSYTWGSYLLSAMFSLWLVVASLCLAAFIGSCETRTILTLAYVLNVVAFFLFEARVSPVNPIFKHAWVQPMIDTTVFLVKYCSAVLIIALIVIAAMRYEGPKI